MSRIKYIAPTDVAAVVSLHKNFVDVKLTNGERINLLDFEYRILQAGDTLALTLHELG